jgi:hypothetical protein
LSRNKVGGGVGRSEYTHEVEDKASNMGTVNEILSVLKPTKDPARRDSRGHASATPCDKAVAGPDVSGEDEYAWGDDIHARPKIGECGVGLIDGRCTDGDGCRNTSRGDKTRVYALISGRDNDGDAFVNGVGHLRTHVSAFWALVVRRKNAHRRVKGIGPRS